MVMVVMPMLTVLDTVMTGLRTGQFARQKSLQSLLYGPGSASSCLHTKLLEEFYGPAPHPPADHYVCLLLGYETGHLTRAVLGVKGIFDGFYIGYFLTINF